MCRQARSDVSRFKWILTVCCSWVWQSVNHICNTKSQQLTYFNHGLGGEQHQHHCWVLGAVTLVKRSIVFMLITLISCLSAVMCAFRNERARWITALGRNVNNKKCQDRASKFPHTHNLYSLAYCATVWLFVETVFPKFCSLVQNNSSDVDSTQSYSWVKAKLLC